MRPGVRRHQRVLLALVLVLVGSVFLAVAVGAVWIPPASTARLVLWKIGIGSRPDVARSTEVILFQLRLPRVLLAGVVGAALAVSGLVFQGLFRNDLADPAIIGVSSGAALGAIVVIAAGASAALGYLDAPLAVSAAAFVGALVTAFLVARLARVGPAIHVATLLLAGIAVAALISAVISMIMAFSGEEIRSIYFWLLGGVGARGWGSLALIAPMILVGVAAAGLESHNLNLMSLGEERAAQLGVDLDRLKRRSIAIGALLAGAAVSVAGVIGFVGLITPHLMRLVVGADNRRLLPAVVLAGATLLIGADLVARAALAPEELPLGAVTALLGAPFFLFLLRREGRRVGSRG